MDELNRLVSLVDGLSSKSAPLINFQDENNLHTKLFHLLKANGVKNDKEAAFLLYGDENSTASYRMLKSRLRRKLINHVHFLKLPEDKGSTASIIKAKCASMLFEAESLKTVNELSLADKILEEAFTLAQKNEVHDYIVLILEQKQWVSQMLSDKKKFDGQAKKLKHYYALEKAERSAIGIFQEFMILVKTYSKSRADLFEMLPDSIRLLKALWLKHKSSKIFYYYHFLNIQYNEFKGDYLAVSELVESAEKMVQRRVLHPNWFNLGFNSFARFYALLQTKQYEKGLNIASKYLSYFEAGSLNWFAFMENYLLMSIHSKNYQTFYKVYLDLYCSKSLSKLPVAHLERLELFRRYSDLLIIYCLKDSKIKNKKNVVPMLSLLQKDKEGYNVGIIIIETIDMLSDASIDDYEAQVERLKKYIQKHLRGDKAVRARLFLRLLILVFREEFNLKSIKEKGDSMLLKLTKTPFPGDAFAEVEIIPYEHLWEIVLEVVEQRQALLH